MKIKKWLASSLLLLALGSTARKAHALGDSVTWDPVTQSYTLTWDPVLPSTDTASVSYLVYFDFGYVGSPSLFVKRVSGTTFQLSPPSVAGLSAAGTYSFMVVSSDSITGLGGVTLLRSSSFIHHLYRADANSTEDGHGQVWNVEAKMQDDARVWEAIYPPGTVFSTDGLGFTSSTSTMISSAPVKILSDFMPRSGEGSTGVKVKNTWDSRNSSGTIMPNGIYWYAWIAKDVNGVIRDSEFMSIPVDIMRIYGLSATSISASASTAKINYTLTADGLVTILICKSGTKFAQAQSGGSVTYLSGAYTYAYAANDNVPLNAAGTAIDGTQILRIIKVFRGRGAQTETWNGTDQAGTALSRGIYAFTISEKDNFGNFAVQASGNDGPIADTVSIDQTAPANTGGGSTGGGTGGGGTTTIDTTAPTVDSVTPSSASTITAALSAVSAVISDNSGGSGINGNASLITLTDSSGTSLAGTQSFDSATGVLKLTLTSALGRTNNGLYTLGVKAVDASGNSSILSSTTFTLAIVDPNVFAQGSPIYAYPNPAKNATNVSFAFTTNRPTEMTLRVFSITGQLVYETHFTSGSGAQSAAWDLKNGGGGKITSGLYICKIEGQVGSAKDSVTKKFVVIQ